MKTEVFRMGRVTGALATVALLGACATAPIPYKNPVSVTPPSGRVAVSQSVTVFDASGSQAETFAESKATLESIVAAMPNGSYDAGHVHFGGRDREETGVSRFNRGGLASAAKNAAFLEGTTPLYSVFEKELAGAIGGGSGKAAVIVISDGLVTDYAGRSDSNERTLEAARQVASDRAGEVCFHTVQSGDSADGAALLRSISNVTSCGSFRNASSLGSASALQDFSRNVYLGGPAPAPPPRQTTVSTPMDTDGDGVSDANDKCPGTLKRARVNSRGCWTLHDLRFAVNGAAIEAGFTSTLAEDIDVLKANPDVRVRIDGHTDSDGSAAYNQGLSERRAASVRDYFVSQGIDAGRLEIKGFGETDPIVPNDSRENKRRNRRVVLTIID